MSNLGFRVFKPSIKPLPIILSFPHTGIMFPRSEEHWYKPEFLKQPLDTDWNIDRLYKFGPEMGITMIRANYSRYLIDLNRGQKPDAKHPTSLCPTTTLDGQPIMKEKKLNEEDINQRMKLYYWPYYQEIESLIAELKMENKKILVWDAHSIRSRLLPTPSPTFVVSDHQGKSCSPELVNLSLSQLKDEEILVHHNNPFSGGYLSQYFGKPMNNTNSLQVIVNQDSYMNEESLTFDEGKADMIRPLLKKTLLCIAEELKR